MRFASLGLFALAGLEMVVAPPASGATVAKPPLSLLVTPGVHAGPRPQPRLRGRTATPGGCTNDALPDFIGITGLGKTSSGNFAGSFSSVLGGYSNEACSNDDAVAGGYLNIIGATGDNGAAQASFIGTGYSNAITGSDAFIGAGGNNLESGNYSFLGGGWVNAVSGGGSFIGAGVANTASGDASFVGGGFFNNALGNGSFIGAGDVAYYLTCQTISCAPGGNTVTGVDSFIGDGDANSVSANEAFVGGGSHNAIAGSAEWGTIAGGHDNTVSGALATIPGGANNTAAGVLSLAAGYHADATRTGSFVWSDYVSGSTVVKDSAPDQFVVRASGGTYVYSSENLKAGVKLAAGSGTWASLSDRDAKTGVAPLDDAAILAKVATLPVSTWRYKTEAGVRHVGPMAQDFYAAFRVGEDDRHITSIDEDGVALSAIKALHAENVRLHAGNVKLRVENATILGRLAALEKKVEMLAARENHLH